MYTLARIRELGTVIRNETRRFFNTGARIDEIIQAIIDHLNGIENEGLLIHNDLGGRDSADCHQISVDCRKYRNQIFAAWRENSCSGLPARCAAPAWAGFPCRSR